MQVEKVTQYIISWLKEYASNAGVKGFVIGVSGGIDSAVTSTLCAKTGFPTLCLEMPIHQEKNQVNRATRHISFLKDRFKNVNSTSVNLTPVFNSLLEAMPKVDNEDDRFMSLANTRARLRMTSLYYFAGLDNLLVAGTGNKVEDFGVGFYTKYGDGWVDLSPIADLSKTQVRALAKELGIDEAILTAPPTDGLWDDDRNDEEQLGATYEQLEWAMKEQQNGKTPTDFVGENARVFKVFLSHHNANKHKMEPIPICNIPVHLL